MRRATAVPQGSIRVLIVVLAFAGGGRARAATAADPATASPKVIEVKAVGAAPTGPYAVVVEHDPSLETHTIYRPEPLGRTKHPVVVWGEGACLKTGLMFPEFLSEIASHGFVVVADGPPVPYDRASLRRPPAPDGQAGASATPPVRPHPTGAALVQAIDWAVDQNTRKGGRFHGKLDTSKVAAMGMSCGGLMAYAASGDPRIRTIGIWNSGLFERDPALFDALRASVILITGGPEDIAYKNALADYEAMPSRVPLFYGVYPSVGHFGTYAQDNGGPFGAVAVAWLKWQLMGDTGDKAKGLFAGPGCALCQDPAWQIKKKNMP